VVVRENVEDLYAGIEHMQTPDVAQCLKLISSKGCDKIMRTAFEFARSEGRKSVACATKANIMKKTEGLVKSTFEKMAKDYPDLESWHIIIDNCAHQLAKKPEQFDVIVTTNMNGDIISDLGSGLIGGLGFAPGANIGHDVAIFEAVHGSAPKYAGKDTINPTAMILSGVMMLRYLGEFEAATTIENAVIYTLESGVHTRDVVTDTPPVGTKAYTQAILANFGKVPSDYKIREHKAMKVPARPTTTTMTKAETRETVGMDVFVEYGGTAAELGPKLEAACAGTGFKLKMISNRGTVVYPLTGTSPDVVDQWRCRLYLETPVTEVPLAQVNQVLGAVENQGLRWMHLEKLCKFDGVDSFTKAQGEN
ncbi:MAG: isocitrate dehydrogenase, partial [Verrucomicrobia bacterium]|nr:isocitrate dehydrogenase [Verrucomicrobiota bacterium]